MQRIEYSARNLDKIVDFLRKGKIVIHPTDTCYGLAGDILNRKTIDKIYQFKQMSKKKPMSILVNSLEMFKKYGELNNLTQKIVKKYLPGELTLLVPKTQNIPDFYVKNTNLIGIRLPNHYISLEIVNRLKNPITTTSANLTGEIQAYTAEEVVSYFGDQDVVFFDAGSLPKKEPSTIIKIVENSFEIIRQGDLLLKNF